MSQTYNVNDVDPIETKEWVDAIRSVVENEGADRARFLLEQLLGTSSEQGVAVPAGINTPYQNTIPVDKQVAIPGDQNIEHAIRAAVRWNNAAMVVNAQKKDKGLGGHIGSFLSAATLYDVGFDHFWRAKGDGVEGDLVFMQGHSAPGIYARAYVEGRLSDE